MHLETVDLLMMEGMRADKSVGPEESSACKTETRVRRERTVFVEPGTNSTVRNLTMVSPAHDSLCFCEGVAEIEGRNAFENDVERICFILACGTREAMQTFGATKHLQGLQTVAAHTFLDGELASAGGARRVLVSLSGYHFVRTEGIRMEVWCGGGGKLRVFSQQDGGKSVKRGSRILPG